MGRKTPAQIRKVMGQTFNEAQHTKTCHPRLIKKLKKLYHENDWEPVLDSIIRCLKHVLHIKSQEKTVQNTLDFATLFAKSLQPAVEPDNDEEQELNRIYQGLLEFCLVKHRAVDEGVRYRCCYLINLLLNSMDDNASISEEICEEIRDAMTERLLDIPKIRVQAIAAMHRMQDPHNQHCSIIKMYVYHMSKDRNADVRKAAIHYSAKNQIVLQSVLKRIRDIDDSVRTTAYSFFSKITVRSLKIKERQDILKTGLNDTCQSVVKVVKENILPSWLSNYDNDYCQFLYALDIEFATELGLRVLNTMFERAKPDILFQQLPLDRDAKLIPIDRLRSENVSYWRCLIEYLHKKSDTDEIAADYLLEIKPELTAFCQYIRHFQQMITDYAAQHDEHNQRDPKRAEEILTKKMSHQFIHLQLFEITKTYDLSDEVGRSNLRKLIEDTLISDLCTIPIIECIVRYYEKVVDDVPSRLTSLAHVISEIRVPIQVAENVVEDMSDEELNERLIQCQKLKNLVLQKEDEVYELAAARKFGEAEAVQQEINKLKDEIKELSTTRPPIEPRTQEEPKNDAKTMIKCLTILYTMGQAKTVKTLTPTLRSLYDNLALPSIEHADATVQAQALKAVGICIFLNGELAKKHLMMYFVAMTTNVDNPELWLICLDVIFDLFLHYGLEYFEGVINNDTVDNSRETHDGSRRQGTRLYSSSDDTGLTLDVETGENTNNLIKILLNLIDHVDRDVRTVAVTGFCKLLLHSKLKSNNLVSDMIIRFCDNPLPELDIKLRGSLKLFFTDYPHFTPDGSLSLQQVFIPILKKLAADPDKLSHIDPFNVAKFIINLTSSDLHKPNRKNYTAHNQLALDILREIADEKSVIDEKMLLKSLKLLIIHCDNDEMKNDMREAVDNVIAIINPSQRAFLKYLDNFRRQLELPGAPEDHQEAAAPEENRQSPEFEPMENGGPMENDEDTENDDSDE